MIIETFEQKSPEWERARLGIPTASEFARIITPKKGGNSTQSETYMNELLAEWAAGEPVDQWQGSKWTERGTGLESDARNYYEFTTGTDVQQVGFVWLDEQRMVGCSPDGLIGEDGGIELKCPKGSTHVQNLITNRVPSTYVPQIQGSLWITGREWWDFLSYHPSFIENPLLIRVYRDEPYIRDLSISLLCFVNDMLRKREMLIERGIVPATRPVVVEEEWETLEL